MGIQDSAKDGLSAAECATRTGLTVRALRVYEDNGLIQPKRTAGGWRCYGPHELVRLNTIGVLKTAGLTLSQIREVTRLSEEGPTLRHVLEIQIDVWRQRKAAAERGQAVAEMALASLRQNDSLSVDELCNLVRSLDMTEPASDAAPLNAGKQSAVTVDPNLLERYVGDYQLGELSTCALILQDGQLFIQMDPWPPFAMVAESETEFVGSISGGRYSFLTDALGKVTAMTFNHDGIESTCPRIDAATREAIKTRLAARIQSNAPVPGSEAALRRLIDGIRSGNPSYEEMSPPLANRIRKQLQVLQAVGRYLGELQSIEFKGVGKQGWDVYEVRRENGVAQWRIAFADGVITGAMGTLANGP